MIEIIPAIDLLEGKCVRLQKGDYQTSKTYYNDPLEVAKMFEEKGVKRLHIVDLNGAKAGAPVHLSILEKIATNTSLKIEFGGGVKSTVSVEDVFSAGAAWVIGGSIAVNKAELFKEWLLRWGEQIILGVDVRDRKVAINGWLEDTDVDMVSLIEEYCSYGLKQIICTDIAKDGMLVGPSFKLYQELQERFPQQQIIASGGVSSRDDLTQLSNIGIEAAIVGKAFYEGKLELI